MVFLVVKVHVLLHAAVPPDFHGCVFTGRNRSASYVDLLQIAPLRWQKPTDMPVAAVPRGPVLVINVYVYRLHLIRNEFNAPHIFYSNYRWFPRIATRENTSQPSQCNIKSDEVIC